MEIFIQQGSFFPSHQEKGCTHQLILAATAEGFLDSWVPPQGAQRRYVQLERGRLDGHPSFVFKSHQKHAVLLILRVLPRDSQFVPCINQNPAALKNNLDIKSVMKRLKWKRTRTQSCLNFRVCFFFFKHYSDGTELRRESWALFIAPPHQKEDRASLLRSAN